VWDPNPRRDADKATMGTGKQSADGKKESFAESLEGKPQESQEIKHGRRNPLKVEKLQKKRKTKNRHRVVQLTGGKHTTKKVRGQRTH